MILRNTSLKKLLFVYNILFSLTIVLVLGVFSSITLYRQRLSEVERILEERNQSVNYFMENFFRETKFAVNFLSSLDVVIRAGDGEEEDVAEVLDIYKNITAANDYIGYVFSGYEDGSMLIHDYIPPEGYDPRIRPWYTIALESSPDISISEPYREIKTKVWLSSTSKTLINEEGEITGVVSLDYTLDLLNKLLRENHSAFNSSYSFILKDDGEIIIHHYEDRLKMNLYEDIKELSPDDFTGRSGSLSYHYNGSRKIGYYSRIEDNDWIIMTVVNRSELISSIFNHLSMTLVVILIFSLAWGYFQSLFLERRIVRPLQQLKEHTESIVAGTDLNRNHWIYPENEIGQIAEKTMTLARDELLKKNRELEENRQELIKISSTDQLTGIYNRRELEKILNQEAGRYRRSNADFSVLLMDIDFFKNVNDTHGHDAGDAVLVEISKLFRSSLRSTDVVGRWGGEEFLIICPDTNLSGVVPLAEKIRFLVEESLFSRDLKITISIGAAGIGEARSLDDLLKRADDRLYQAKKEGRNRVVSA